MGPKTGAGMSRGATTEEANPNDIPVEIVGVIYIYNPPDLAKLGTGAASEKAEEAATGEPPAPTGTPGTTPAAAPPAEPPATPAAPASPAAPPAEPATEPAAAADANG